MKMNRSVRSTRNVLAVAATLALAVVPAAAAIQAQDSAAGAADGRLVAEASVTAAPAIARDVSPAVAEFAGSAAGASRGEATAAITRTSTATSAAAAVPTDDSGSTEAQTVQRSCGASADSHYVPSRGRDSQQCYDQDGNFQPSRKYTATYYSNNVTCGKNNELPNPFSVTDTNFYGTAGADGGYVSVCSDGLTPVHGRATASADADGSATVVADGDKDNPEETTQGWASATVSADGPQYRCGKSYAEGGRGTADAPTSADNADQCGP